MNRIDFLPAALLLLVVIWGGVWLPHDVITTTPAPKQAEGAVDALRACHFRTRDVIFYQACQG
jgi:hypothetical protein